MALGADKVSLNTAAVRDPDLLGGCARLLGRQAVVLAVDVKQTRPGAWEVVVEGGRTPTGLDALDWIRRGWPPGPERCFSPPWTGTAPRKATTCPSSGRCGRPFPYP